jgi:hypothetical protein
LSIRLIGFLTDAIQGENNGIEPRRNQPICPLPVLEEMAVRAGYEFDSLLLGIGDHLVDGWVEEGLPPIPEKNQKNVIAYFIDEFLIKIKIHMPTRSIHTRGDGAEGAPEVAPIRGLYLKVRWPTPGMFRLEIDRSFDDDPIKKFLKWDVMVMVRDAVAFDSYPPSGQSLHRPEGFRNQLF